jgi:hypothetical protein
VVVLLVSQLHILFSSVALMSSSSTSKGASHSTSFSLLPTTLNFRFMGGNSTRATSGINGTGTQTPQDHGIVDSAKIFFDDAKHSVRVIRTLLLT